MYPDIKHILYATDMGDHMRPVFRYAIAFAKKHKASVTMLHVLEPLSAGVEFSINIYMPNVSVKDVVRDNLKKALAKMEKRLEKFSREELKKNPQDRKLITEVKAVSGRPAEVITQQAEKLHADMIVMGTHTDPTIGSHLIGSTARLVTQTARTPVLIVPVYAE